ncbi:MAG: tyrosine-type recombinase/integrase [Phocaeicola sp.]|nr:tyrosine-type recombinase/integrase [Phocaeicola sp.]
MTEPVYLTEKEIARLSSVSVNNELEEIIRDAFVISCYTALRISDIYRINEAEISKSTITMYQSKTKERVVIPILKEVGALVNKYRTQGIPKIHSGKLNNTIRELAKRCNITQSVTYREIRGGEVSLLSVPKYKLISFHTARRSCVTNLYKRGYPVNYIMTLSGHKSIQAFQRYMRASSKDIMNNFFSLLKKNKAIACGTDEQ